MPSSVDNQVLDFYSELFNKIFSEPFYAHIPDRRRYNAVVRQIGEAGDAASSSLTRFFLNQKLDESTVEGVLKGFSAIVNLLKLENIANPNITTEEVAENLLSCLPCPSTIQKTHDAVYRLALFKVVQVLMLVGPVMAEWQKLNFSSTFELPGRVVNQLNQISEQINAQGQSGQGGADERYELEYRDYLLTRFHRVEAGTVRMTTNMDVDLRELFVMPYVLPRKYSKNSHTTQSNASESLMDLKAARKLFGEERESSIYIPQRKNSAPKKYITALEQVKKYSNNVVIGLPGAGKSTFFEWLQVRIASAKEIFILGDQQAIPLLLRVRQLDPINLPYGAALIEKATASKDRAAVMPPNWIERQMKAGRVLFMLDGLDETEPELRDKYLIPWLIKLCKEYPDCHYLISSRPVGYFAGTLQQFKFVECDLLDFEESQIQEYTRHWCTAVRLARNESDEEARREGKRDGEHIVDGFKNHPYIRNLARNPLMLSAICLVNYFEDGRLPEDRALLYQLCVEGLLHNWDKRRGIHSDFSLNEKLRTCREVALAMQADDRAEYEADKVRDIFITVLGDPNRAAKLLEHIRYRTGLLLERRPDVFGFAHLTFQEYLAAQAVHNGNQLGIDAKKLVCEHDDGRWKEVIALYCGLTTTPSARNMIEQLIAQSDTKSLAELLTETYFSAGAELTQDLNLRRLVLERIALAPTPLKPWNSKTLERFKIEEVAPIANLSIGSIQGEIGLSTSHSWLRDNPQFLDMNMLIEKLKNWHTLTPRQLSEIVHLIHRYAPARVLRKVLEIDGLYSSPGPIFNHSDVYISQAEIALIGLSRSSRTKSKKIVNFSNVCKHSIIVAILTILKFNQIHRSTLDDLLSILGIEWRQGHKKISPPKFSNTREKNEFINIVTKLVEHLKLVEVVGPEMQPHPQEISNYLIEWVNLAKMTTAKEQIESSV